MVRRDANGQYVFLAPTLGDPTVIHDCDVPFAIMTIQGGLALPIDAEIELIAPNINATVTGIWS